MKKILVIGDVHLKSGTSNERMTWLGHYIAEDRPDVVVQVGDLEDMPSLSSFDVGKKSFEGRTYQADVKAVIDGQTKLFAPINEYNQILREKKQKLYKPRMVLLGGNHGQGRIERAINSDRKLEGTISVDDFKYKEFGWEYCDFKEIVDVEGISFTHYFTAGLMDRPIGGQNLARNILNKTHSNAVQGHCHTLDYATSTLTSGKRIFALVAGCYFDHVEDYVTRRAQNEWWRGVCSLTMDGGELEDISFITLKTLRREYS